MRQTIGHRSLNSTSSYVTQMTDQDRTNRIFRIKGCNTFIRTCKNKTLPWQGGKEAVVNEYI